jgi:transcriptional regulator with XRE-family HTH domain
MSIGQRIKETRIQQGLSRDDLACKLGKNRTTIYRYENGDIENLPLGILDSLADALNTTPAYLMGWETPQVMETTICENDPPPEAAYVTKWLNLYGGNTLNEEECEKVLEYAKFLLSIREN